MIQNQREELNLKVGDKAYYLVDETYGIFDLVTIVGQCDEGHGYEAISPWWAENYPPKEGDLEEWESERDRVPGCIHTCNNTLFKTKREARAETIRILKVSRKRFVESEFLRSLANVSWRNKQSTAGESNTSTTFFFEMESTNRVYRD